VASSDAMRLEPNSPDVLTSRGLVLFLTAKNAQALKHVSSALSLDPGHEPAMRLRKRIKDVDRLKDEGNVAFKAGQLELAKEKYSEALEVRALRSVASRAQVFTYFILCSESVWKILRVRVATYVRCCFRTGPLPC
jgi:tetratricopeptide (TPR) repeat protein